MKWINCTYCDKQVSSPIADGVQLRAWVLCRECARENALLWALSNLRKTIIDAAVESDWCHPGLGEALHQAEQLLPKHLH